MATLVKKAEFKSFGAGAPVYEVLEVKADSVKIQVVLTGEVIENYPLSDYLNDPTA